MTKMKILRRITTKDGEKTRHEIQLCQVPEWDNRIIIRPCYYTKQKNKDGDDFWNISPRPLTFGMDEVVKVLDAIKELKDTYDSIKRSIETEH